jgi:hypothetical protein
MTPGTGSDLMPHVRDGFTKLICFQGIPLQQVKDQSKGALFSNSGQGSESIHCVGYMLRRKMHGSDCWAFSCAAKIARGGVKRTVRTEASPDGPFYHSPGNT